MSRSWTSPRVSEEQGAACSAHLTLSWDRTCPQLQPGLGDLALHPVSVNTRPMCVGKGYKLDAVPLPVSLDSVDFFLFKWL